MTRTFAFGISSLTAATAIFMGLSAGAAQAQSTGEHGRSRQIAVEAADRIQVLPPTSGADIAASTAASAQAQSEELPQDKRESLAKGAQRIPAMGVSDARAETTATARQAQKPRKKSTRQTRRHHRPAIVYLPHRVHAVPYYYAPRPHFRFGYGYGPGIRVYRW